MEREQIIKALECHISGKLANCEHCPFDKAHLFNSTCVQAMCENALALIKELTEENEFHRKTISKNAQMALNVTVDEIEKTKTDTVQKMQERLKYSLCCIPQCHFTYAEVQFHIDRITKEMLEENK